MTTTDSTPRPATPVTVLGLGAMGSALAATALAAGHPVTVWNRTPGRADALVTRGAREATAVGDAVMSSPVVVACLLKHPSVHEALDPVVDRLSGRTLLNVTTTTPDEARELAAWAAERGITYVDGAILATPPMIGAPEAQLFLSGSRAGHDLVRPLVSAWATTEYHGADPGAASLIDLALLSGMYQMFTGLFHGAAMVESAGMDAQDFAARATPFIGAMVPAFHGFAAIVDGGDYTVDGQQSLDFSDLSHIVRASDEQGVDPAPVAAVQSLISRQIGAGHGQEGFARIFESLRSRDVDEADIA